RGLYEPTEPNQQGLLPVDDTHSLFYHVYGNSTSQHVALSLHGGPGAGSFPRHARFFDPKRCRVVLFDQRGCGSSTPRGDSCCLLQLTSQQRLRVHLNVSTWDIVLGGSWGSTLALAYSQEYPERVRAMVLRGVCLMRAKEICWLMSSSTSSSIQGVRERLAVRPRPPSPVADAPAGSTRPRLFSSNTTTQGAAARRWSDCLVSESRPAPSAPYVPAQVSCPRPSPSNRHDLQAMLTCWYSLHGGFLEEEAILQPQRMERIRHIPCIAVQGAADYICPPWTALDLHEAWPEMKLRLVAGAGHSMYDPEITSELVKATD
ncbi:hypothetical protein GUITHDRAFT_59395, partial [Guillardia theta CCMP2712]